METAGHLVIACHCGQAKIHLPRKPELVIECNCSLCSKLGWKGAYFSSDELVIEGKFDSYVRSDIKQPMIRVQRCMHCGTTTHWTPLGEPPYARMGVNARLLDETSLRNVPVRQVDGRGWDI